jgi:hypothetical protein
VIDAMRDTGIFATSGDRTLDEDDDRILEAAAHIIHPSKLQSEKKLLTQGLC